MSEPRSIVASRQLIVEGRDDALFFQTVIGSLSLTDIQVQPTDGKDNTKDFLRALVRMPSFGRVTSLGIVRDADKNAQNAFARVQADLRAAKLPYPASIGSTAGPRPNVIVLVLPDPATPGALETLCLRSVAASPAATCVDGYFACLKANKLPRTREMDKARAHAFLASCEAPDLRVGEAAARGYWNLAHPAFDDLKIFLRML